LNRRLRAVSVRKMSERMSNFWTVQFFQTEYELIFGFLHSPTHIQNNWVTDTLNTTAADWVQDKHDSVNNRPVKRLTLVARLPRAFYIGPHAGWDYGIVTPFFNSKLGRRLKCWPTWLACIHSKRRTLVFLIHAHFAVTTVLSNVLSNNFFMQNKLTITFNKMITSGKSDWSYPSCLRPKWAAC